MRLTRCCTVKPGRPGLPAWILGGVFLLALAPSPAYGAEFGSPLILGHPDPPVAGQEHWFGGVVVLDGDVLAMTAVTFIAEDRWMWEVFIYERRRHDPADWRLTQRLRSDELGFADGLALSGGTLAITGYGAVHIYERDEAGVWRRQRSLKPKLPGFPGAMSLDGDRLAVGLPKPLSKVLIFERNRPSRGRWGLTARLQGELTSPVFQGAPDFFDVDEPAPFFGKSVAISGDRLVVGSSSHVCCGKGSPTSNSVFIFARDPQSPEGWRQLHNFESPGRRGTVVGQSVHDEVRFGETVFLSGPVLLAGEGFNENLGAFHVGQLTMHIYEQNHRGPDGWGHRRELRPGGTSPHLRSDVSALRGNTAAVAESRGESSGIRVFERNFPVRNAWALRDRLPTEFWGVEAEVIALGPRELVASDSRKVLVFPRTPILEDGFESGTLRKWSPNPPGAVEIVSPGLAGSDSALAVQLGAGFAVLRSRHLRREPSVSLSFSLFPNAVNLRGKRVEILRLWAGKPTLRLSLEEGVTDPDYRAVLEVRLRDGSWQRVGKARFRPDREAVVGIEYSAATAAGAGDGATRFEINGHLIREARRLDLGRPLITRLTLGLPQGSPPQASGSFLVDDFVMHR